MAIDDDILVSMPDSTSRCSQPEPEERRRAAVIAFLAAGMHSPPSPALSTMLTDHEYAGPT
jgi:hypothetical protein